MVDVRNEIKSLLLKLGIYTKEPCTDDENKQFQVLEKQKEPLPEDIGQFENGREYYRIIKTDLTDDEVRRLLMLKQTYFLSIIKNCMLFIVAMTIVLIIYFLILSR